MGSRVSMRRILIAMCAGTVFGAAFFCVPFVHAQLVHAQQTSARVRATNSNSSPGIYLVFPFENAGASPRLDWLREGLEELAIERLASAGQQVFSRTNRMNELERYGLPISARVSRATMLRIAEDLDADFVVFGSFTSDGTSLTVESRVMKVAPTALLTPVHESGPLDSLIDLQTRVVWRTLSANGHGYPVNLADFSKAQRPLRLDAFEHYIRGLLAAEDDARLRELREAAKLEPNWPEPHFALGEAYLGRRDCNSALPWYALVPKNYNRYFEAAFATGVCRLLLNDPVHAEEIFSGLQEASRKNMAAGGDLPEILNNLALAQEREGKMPAAQEILKRATEVDPEEDDYPFNLGLLALRSNDFAGAVEYFREASEREPDNPEDRALMIFALEKAGKKTEADQERGTAAEAFGPNGLPAVRPDAKGEWLTKLDRVKMELDTTAMLLGNESAETMNASEEASSSSNNGTGSIDTAVAHVRRGRQELTAGQADSAEKEFRAALALDANSASAHQGLAEIFRHQGKLDDAIKELQSSLGARDSAVVRTTLARIYLEQKKNDLARAELERALKLAPNYSDAKQLLQHLQSGASPTAPASPTGAAGAKPHGGAL